MPFDSGVFEYWMRNRLQPRLADRNCFKTREIVWKKCTMNYLKIIYCLHWKSDVQMAQWSNRQILNRGCRFDSMIFYDLFSVVFRAEKRVSGKNKKLGDVSSRRRRLYKIPTSIFSRLLHPPWYASSLFKKNTHGLAPVFPRARSPHNFYRTISRSEYHVL